MKLDQIITLANARTELPFRAMARSLRAVGSDLPLLVIPYDDRRFVLPDHARWLDDAPAQALFQWLDGNGGHPTMRKYACLLRENYLFVDTDVVFLQNPAAALAPYDGFITNCCHWSDPNHTLTDESRPFFENRSTTYAKTLFNSGQFACDRALYDFPSLQAACDRFPLTCLTYPYHEQPALNLLVHASGCPITPLTLPPHNFESSWAGHYLRRQPPFWTERTTQPFLLHWAGRKFSGQYPIDELFLRHLTAEERGALLAAQAADQPTLEAKAKGFLRGVRRSFGENFSRPG